MSPKPSVLVFVAILALPAFSEEAPPAAPSLPKEAAGEKALPTAQQPAVPSPPGSANLVVTKDPETGELRPATAAEREKLLGRRPLARVEHRVVTLPDGSQMVELGEADMSYAVATRKPDGTITRSCVHGDPKASKAAASAAPAAPAPKTADR